MKAISAPLMARGRVASRVALRVALVATLFFSSFAHAAFLEPERAFVFSARTVRSDTVEVSYRIADGYYLYRERFKFALDPAASGGATLGDKFRGKLDKLKPAKEKDAP